MSKSLVFYEKPGCASNARQKHLLQSAGVDVIARNVLTEPWTSSRLREFFQDLPLDQWFNPAAPRIKNGEIDPAQIDAAAALSLMLADPLLIRRPLIESAQFKIAGFDWDFLSATLKLSVNPHDQSDTLETCRHPRSGQRCKSEV